jgi:predicted  nucleic acid-binding Zn-ribbon protein
MVDFAARTLWGDEAMLGAIMDINTALRAIESKQYRGQAESGDLKTSAEELAALLSRVSEAPTREIEKLINQLQGLRTQLQNAGNRIQRDIAQHTELSQQTMQLTAIISDSVKKLPDAIDRKATGASVLLQ